MRKSRHTKAGIPDNQQQLRIKKDILSVLRSGIRVLIPFLALIVIVIFFQVVSKGRLLTVRNLKVILNQVFAIAIGATGVLFVMSQGNIDLSIGAIVGISGALAARGSVVSTLVVLPIAVLTGLAVGSFNGLLIARFRVPSFIGTLAVSFVLRGLIIQILEIGSAAIPLSMLSLDNTTMKVTVLTIVLIGGWIVFEHGKIGKHSKAIGSQQEVARQCGVNVPRTKLISFIIAGFFAGLVGFFNTVRAGTASTTTGIGFEIDVLNALLLGGIPIMGGVVAKFRGVIVGSVIIGVLTNGMTMWGVDTMTQQMIEGIIFIAAVSLSFDRRNTAVIK